MIHENDTIVIGGGPAGITFTRDLRKLNPTARVTVFRPEAHSLVYCAIPYAIEGLFDPNRVHKRDDLVTETGAELIRRNIVNVDFAARTVRDEAGEEYRFQTLFIATGASPIRPRMPGAAAPNVFTVKTEEDMIGIIAKIAGGARKAVVVGAGAIGIEQAQAYRARGLETWLIDMAPHVLPAMVDADMSEPLHEALRTSGVHLHCAVQVKALECMPAAAGQESGPVAAVQLADGERVALDPETDFVCFAIGMKPDVALFADRGLALHRDGIVVDNRMRTVSGK